MEAAAAAEKTFQQYYLLARVGPPLRDSKAIIESARSQFLFLLLHFVVDFA